MNKVKSYDNVMKLSDSRSKLDSSIFKNKTSGHLNTVRKHIAKVNEHNDTIESGTTPKGEISMDKNYVTKAELDMHSKIIDAKLDSVKEGTYSRMDNLNFRMDSLSNEIKSMGTNLNDNMEKTIKLALHEKEDEERKERKETNRYIIGTLVLGGLGLLATIVGLILK